MDLKTLKDWGAIIASILVWIFTLGAVWARLNSKIDQNKIALDDKASKGDLNGLGGRVGAVEGTCSETSGRMDRFERELSEYRTDAREAANLGARTEKAVEDLNDAIQNNHLALGTQLHGIEKLIQEKDKSTSNRLVRIETLQAIEKKIGPIPEDK